MPIPRTSIRYPLLVPCLGLAVAALAWWMRSTDRRNSTRSQMRQDDRSNSQTGTIRQVEAGHEAARAPTPPSSTQTQAHLWGQAVRLGDKIKPPKLLRRVEPKLPVSQTRRTCRGLYNLECVTNREGDVVDSHFLKKAVFEPPWPEYEEAIVDAVRQWRYEWVSVDRVPQPFIFTVTLTVCPR